MSHPAAAGLFLAGQKLARSGEWAEAESVFRAALALDPANLDALRWLAAATTDIDETVELLAHACTLAPDDLECAANLAWAIRQRAVGWQRGEVPWVREKSLHVAASADLTDVIAGAGTALRQGDAAAAVRSLELAAQAAPAAPDVLAHLGLAYYQAGRPADAEKIYLQMLTTDPNHAEAHANLGLIYSETSRPDLAEASYRRALAAAPDLDEVRLALADLLAGRGWIDAAVAEWRWLADRRPAIGEYRVKIADAFSAAGRHDDAITAYIALLERNGDDASLRLRLARALRASGRVSSAVEHYRLAASGPNAPVDALIELAEALAEVGYADAAREAVGRALVFAPTDARAIALADRLHGGPVGGAAAQRGILGLLRRR